MSAGREKLKLFAVITCAFSRVPPYTAFTRLSDCVAIGFEACAVPSKPHQRSNRRFVCFFCNFSFKQRKVDVRFADGIHIRFYGPSRTPIPAIRTKNQSNISIISIFNVNFRCVGNTGKIGFIAGRNNNLPSMQFGKNVIFTFPIQFGKHVIK